MARTAVMQDPSRKIDDAACWRGANACRPLGSSTGGFPSAGLRGADRCASLVLVGAVRWSWKVPLLTRKAPMASKRNLRSVWRSTCRRYQRPFTWRHSPISWWRASYRPFPRHRRRPTAVQCTRPSLWVVRPSQYLSASYSTSATTGAIASHPSSGSCMPSVRSSCWSGASYCWRGQRPMAPRVGRQRRPTGQPSPSLRCTPRWL